MSETWQQRIEEHDAKTDGIILRLREIKTDEARALANLFEQFEIRPSGMPKAQWQKIRQGLNAKAKDLLGAL